MSEGIKLRVFAASDTPYYRSFNRCMAVSVAASRSAHQDQLPSFGLLSLPVQFFGRYQRAVSASKAVGSVAIATRPAAPTTVPSALDSAAARGATGMRKSMVAGAQATSFNPSAFRLVLT